MKTHTFSIVVGTNACNANCPFCVSKMTGPVAVPKEINWRRFTTACRIVEQARDGLMIVLLTGKGEPMLYPQQITDYLRGLENHNFPLVELQTNGTLIKQSQLALKAWHDMGLGLVCISVASECPSRSNELMGIKMEYNYWDAVKQLKDIGLAVRLNCTMLRGGVDSSLSAETLIRDCWHHGVDQLTFRDVTAPRTSQNPPVEKYVLENKPYFTAKHLHHWLEMSGATRLLDLPHGGIVYDYHEQNVCVYNCLTGAADQNYPRQIIFFPDGQIRYDWRYPGARLL